MGNIQKNLYLILGVDPAANADALASAYRRLALRYHPDLNHTTEATLRMQEVNEAYTILRNPLKRGDYDRQFKQSTQVLRSTPTPPRRPVTVPRPAARPPAPPPIPNVPLHTNETIQEQLVIFYLDDQSYAFTIRDVETVMLAQALKPIPGAPGFIAGAIEVRGKMVPVIDLRHHLGLSERQPSRDNRIIISRLDEWQVGLLVDSMENYLMVSSSTINIASSIQENESPFIRGFARIGFQLVILLDLCALLTSEQKSSLARFDAGLQSAHG